MEPKEDEKTTRRQRKKKLIGEVKDVLEFYFSPANLRKDHFMQNLLEKNSNVDLEIFFRFNKIKALTNEIKILQKAVKKSDILALSDDGCRVKRSAPLEMKENDTDCTIYVENLPPNSSHEWLQKVFSIYGVIDYISLPRFQQSSRPKGFAFIEFHTPHEAEKALESFGGLASLDGTLNPAELLTIKTYGQTEEIVDSLLEPSSPTENKETEEKQCKKRPAVEAFAENDNVESGKMSHKKLKVNEEKKEAEARRKQKKKRKKRAKKEKEYEPDSIYLRVMSKRDWKRLRNKYLDMQRENMRELKHYLHHSQKAKKNYSKAKTTKPDFIAGVIAKIMLNEPPQDLKEFRAGLANGRHSIAYIDVSSEKPDVFVRFKSHDDCKLFISEGLWQNVYLLKGEEEKAYWEIIFASWERQRCSKKVNCNSELSAFRGRDKLFTKALKRKNVDSVPQHIVFED